MRATELVSAELVLAQPAGDPYPFLAHTGEILVGGLAFLLLLYLLYKYLWPTFTASHDDTGKKIGQGIKDAEQAEASAQAELADSREKLAGVDADAARIRDDARGDADRIKENMARRADEEAERIRAQGQQSLDASRSRTVAELRSDVGSRSVELAGRIVAASLSDDTRRSESVDRFLDELEGMAGADGTSTNGTGTGTNGTSTDGAAVNGATTTDGGSR